MYEPPVSRLEYVAKIRGTHQRVVLLPKRSCGSIIAQMTRPGRRVEFVPTAAQIKKIRTGAGNVNITTEAIRAAGVYLTCRGR